MSGAVFIVTIPKIEYEEELKKKTKTKRSQELKTDSDITAPNSNEESRCASRSSYTTVDECTNICSYNCKHQRDWIKNPNFKDPIDDVEKQESVNGVSEHVDTRSIPAEQILHNVLRALHIDDAAWSSSQPETHHQIMFSVYGRTRCERVLCALRDAGIGARPHSSFSVLPCALHYKPDNIDCMDTEDDGSSTWGAFVRSVRARQTVHQVVQQVKNDAALTFDFLSLLIVAALVAAMGLVENSTMFLVASMLISPLMGPITAGTFGTAIRDRELFKIGVLNELLGLSLAMIIGFIFGLIVCAIDESYGKGQWPTEEIMARCDIRSLWVGVLIALPSGAAVAISVLSDNTASLVGVAISASLLPPAVNAGLLWGMSLIHLLYSNNDTKFNNMKTHIFSDNSAIELAIDGLISLCLTLINIICIYFAGIFVYMIKEVAPVNSPDIEFWKHDIKAARDFNKTHMLEPKADIVDEKTTKIILENSLPIHSERGSINPIELFDRLNYIRNNYMTWSPNRSVMRKVSVRELQGLHKQFNNEASVKKPTRIRSHSFLSAYKRLNEENPPQSTSQKLSESPTRIDANYQPTERFTVAQVHEENPIKEKEQTNG